MTLLNISLCLPAPDIIALQAKQSIVSITRRFIVPEKSFALLACNDFPGSMQLETLYQESFLTQSSTTNANVDSITHWANCVMCQLVDGDEAISAIPELTIWTKSALQQHTGNRLFLSFLRIYELPKAINVGTAPESAQLYKFLPLPKAVETTVESPVLSSEDFDALKENFFNPQKKTLSSSRSEKKTPEPVPPSIEEILEAPDWIEKIAEYGHSSDGHTFEKLVRKGLIELGFSNSKIELSAALDPTSTGGSGGLDFYADQPYKIVGECKATKTKKVGSNTASQIVRLGLQNLREEEYLGCIKIVVAGGSLTKQVRQMSERHRINVLRPETMQRLVESKISLQEDFDLIELRGHLEAQPFGESADKKINNYLDQCYENWQGQQEHLRLIGQVISTLKELSAQSIALPLQDFSILEIRAHHNAKYEPIVSTSTVKAILDNQVSSLSSGVKLRNHVKGTSGYFMR